MASSSPTTSAIGQAREAIGRGDWHHAYALLVEADAGMPLGTAELPLLAEAAYAAGRPDLTIAAWERAHILSLRAGDRSGAASAAVRVGLHLLIDTGLMAPVRGWIGRAERLLDGPSQTPTHAWLHVVRSYERLLSGDLDAARTSAQLAIEVGSGVDPAAAAVGRVAEARTFILMGDVKRGVELLNEAAVASVSGELDPLTTGVVYCEVVCALQGLALYDLAEEWTAAMEGWRHGKAVGSIHGRCRVHRAEILRLRGSCLDAEKEALAACDELRPYLRRELGWPLTELGRIRLRTGDIDGAEEAFRQAHELGWDPQPGLALVQLARGEVLAAATSIRDAVAHPVNVPSKELPPNSDLRLAPLLEAQVEIEIAVGDLARAGAAAGRLAVIAGAFDSKALAAGAALASGRVRRARGDALGARPDLEQSAHLWQEIGAPYEAALARLELARAHRTSGHEQRAVLEFMAARSAFEQAGAAQRVDDVSREAADAGWRDRTAVEQSGPAPSASPDRPGDVNEFRREGDFWSLAFEGRAVLLRDMKGLRYIARLLGDPGRELHVLDLVALMTDASAGANDPGRPAVASPLGERGSVVLDAQAKEAYRRRLAEIDDDLEEARALGDSERASQAESERDFLMRELTHAVGLGGRDRRWGSASERARASVTKAVRQALVRVRQHHPALADHLDRAIRTGTYCAYLPDSRLRSVWK